MKSLFNKSIIFILAANALSCGDVAEPNLEYMPDMYETVSYETYGEYEIFEGQQEAKLPADGSIPRGWKPYDYENSSEGYETAKEELTNPLPYTEDNLAEGRQLYTIYCAICHGDNGDGQGILVQREKFLGVPSYDDVGRAITEGSVYHVQYYGRNAMGSYASQTSIEERWKITHYVMSLKDELEGNPEREFEEVTQQPQGENMENLVPAVSSDSDNEGESNTDANNAEQGNQN